MKSSSAVAVAALLPAIAFAARTPLASIVGSFDASSNTNMAVYWGQGPNQQRLAHFCADTKIDIIPIGFVNQFPDQTHGYPGSNFGNQCSGTTYKNPDGTTSPLLDSCPYIGQDIKTCQQMGKKILLSLGGAIPSNQHITSQKSATDFAEFLWRAFGPDKEVASSTFPRPFGDAAVDGFDFDIENALAAGENKQDLYYGYSTMINHLRTLYATDIKPRYISGAPQCIVPDAHLADAIQNSWFDFLFVQFYNTAQCSARAYFDHTYGAYGGPATDISFDQWATFVSEKSQNKGTKIFLGLPAAPDGTLVTDTKMYLQPSEAQQIITHFQCKYPALFGGVMIYEATYSEQNALNGKPYADVLKGYLKTSTCAKKPQSSSILPLTSSSAPTIGGSTSSATSSLAALSSSRSFGTSARPSGTSPASSSLVRSGTAPYPTSKGTLPYSTPIGTGTGSYKVSSGTVPLKSTGSVPFSASAVSTSAPLSSGFTGTGSPGSSFPAVASSGAHYTNSSSTGPVISATASTASQGATSESSGASISNGASFSNGASLTSAPTETSMPGQASATTEETTTTVVTTTFVTTCPVTETSTESGSAVLHTTYTISTVTETLTIPVCPRCTASVHPSPIPTAAAETTSLPNEVTSASTLEEVTTIIVYTTTTTCPVTHTLTSGTSEIVQTTATVSTVTETTTSTICTHCVPPPGYTPAPSKPTPPASGNFPFTSPSESGHTGNSPQEQGSSPPASNGESPSSPGVSAPAGSPAPANEASTAPNSPAKVPVNEAGFGSGSGSGSGSSPATAVVASSSHGVQYMTLTLVPEPLTQTQYLHRPQATGAPGAGAIAPSLPAVVVVSPSPVAPSSASSTGVFGAQQQPNSNSSMGSISGQQQPSVLAFTGAASRFGVSHAGCWWTVFAMGAVALMM